MGEPDAALLERARSLTNEAMFTVALQRRRLATTEPEDDVFLFRRWADFQFFIVALRRLRRAAGIASGVPAVATATQGFDATLPGLARLRNVGEHIDDYARDLPTRHDKATTRRDLQVGSWTSTTWRWLAEEVDLDAAVAAAEVLHKTVMAAARVGR